MLPCCFFVSTPLVSEKCTIKLSHCITWQSQTFRLSSIHHSHAYICIRRRWAAPEWEHTLAASSEIAGKHSHWLLVEKRRDRRVVVVADAVGSVRRNHRSLRIFCQLSADDRPPVVRLFDFLCAPCLLFCVLAAASLSQRRRY